MASKYDKVTSASELIKLFRIEGRSTKQEDVCRIQDILGNAPIEDLDVLANDKNVQNIFYSTLFAVWHWEDATRFWNQHTNPQRNTIAELREDHAEMTDKLHMKDKELADESNRRKEAVDAYKEMKEMHDHLYWESENLGMKLRAAEQEILVLKAKLYDLMMEKEGANG